MAQQPAAPKKFRNAKQACKAHFSAIQANPIKDTTCSVTIVDDDILHWRALLSGPIGSPYEGGAFTLNIVFGRTYPNKAPKATMVTPIYHMNINVKGAICIELLTDGWEPSSSISDVLDAVVGIMKEPSVYDALVDTLTKLYDKDPKKYLDNARRCTAKYAGGKDADMSEEAKKRAVFKIEEFDNKPRDNPDADIDAKADN